MLLGSLTLFAVPLLAASAVIRKVTEMTGSLAQILIVIRSGPSILLSHFLSHRLAIKPLSC